MSKQAAAATLSPLSKSAKTRARLIECAISVISRRGVDSAAISEITQKAGLANGTYYLHFRDKAEIVSAVVDHIMTELFRRIGRRVGADWSVAERLSFTTREFIVLASHEHEWGFTMFRSLASVPELRHTASGYVLPMLRSGAACGDFTIVADHFLGNTIVVMNMLAVFSCLNEGEVPLALGIRVAEYQLRLLGVAPDRAAEIANKPLGVTTADNADRLIDPLLS
jgi:AcrR family transcriptional regulator